MTRPVPNGALLTGIALTDAGAGDAAMRAPREEGSGVIY